MGICNSDGRGQGRPGQADEICGPTGRTRISAEKAGGQEEQLARPLNFVPRAYLGGKTQMLLWWNIMGILTYG
jgi:hypothetical protein